MLFIGSSAMGNAVVEICASPWVRCSVGGERMGPGGVVKFDGAFSRVRRGRVPLL